MKNVILPLCKNSYGWDLVLNTLLSMVPGGSRKSDSDNESLFMEHTDQNRLLEDRETSVKETRTFGRNELKIIHHGRAQTKWAAPKVTVNRLSKTWMAKESS